MKQMDYDFFYDHFWKIITIGAICSTLTCGGILKGCNNWQISEGERTGMVNKVSTKGYFWKTWEGQMALEGIVSGSTSMGANIWDFSIDQQSRHGENKEELIKKLQDAINSGEKVKIRYLEMAKTWPWRSGTDHLIQGIDYVNNTRQQSGEIPTPQRLEKTTSEEYKGSGPREVIVDGRSYILKHDSYGKLKVMELKEVQ
jgi:hypothetical protein